MQLVRIRLTPSEASFHTLIYVVVRFQMLPSGFQNGLSSGCLDKDKRREVIDLAAFVSGCGGRI
jgi:hypothetical protein